MCVGWLFPQLQINLSESVYCLTADVEKKELGNNSRRFFHAQAVLSCTVHLYSV